MLTPRRADATAGRAAVSAWAADPASAQRDVIATAVRYTLEILAARVPGRSTEVRVPPFGVVQCVEGPRHTRGTPANVVETDAATWLELACGRRSWGQAVADGQVRAGGERADLSGALPVVTETGEPVTG